MSKTKIYLRKPDTIGKYALDEKYEPDGYDMKSAPQATDDNFAALLEEYNTLTEAFNSLCEHLGVEFDDESS